MGVNYYVAREILRAREQSGCAAVATIGQLQHFMLPGQAQSLCREFNLADVQWARQAFGAYGNAFLHAAGATSVSVLDASAYEGAELIHDMNTPVPNALHEKFDQVIDGGSIEHVFRPDQALANSMRMTRTGGALVIWTPANNLCGHGFYQFSPEFFYSSLTQATGFRVDTALLVECVYPSVSLVNPKRAYRVRSPMEIRDRVAVTSRRPLMLLVRGTKIRHESEPFARTPQQSDFEAQWGTGDAASGRNLIAALELPASVDRLAQRARNSTVGGALVRRALGERERHRFSLRNRRFFTPE